MILTLTLVVFLAAVAVTWRYTTPGGGAAAPRGGQGPVLGRPAGARILADRCPTDPAEALERGRALLRAIDATALVAVTEAGQWVGLSREECCIVFGPPRSGKTTGVSVPALIFHPGPAVVVSSKPDILYMTAAARSQSGRIWVYDPTGHSPTPACINVEHLKWSPLQGCESLERARLRAQAILAAAAKPHTTTGNDRSDPFFDVQCARLLGGLLFTAAQRTPGVPAKGMEDVLDWLLTGGIKQALLHLCDIADNAPDLAGNRSSVHYAARLLESVEALPDKTRGSVIATTINALSAFEDPKILAASADPNFDPDQFPTSGDTIYVIADADRLTLYAPIVASLIDDLKRATYDAHRADRQPHVLCVIEEAARVKLHNLEALAAEGCSQGFQVIAVFQDLAQARATYGPLANSFITLFNVKIAFPGVSDNTTLDGLATLLGDLPQLKQQTRTKQEGYTDDGILGTHSGGISVTITSDLRPRSHGDLAQHHLVVRQDARGFQPTRPATYHADTPTGQLQRTASPRAPAGEPK